MKYKYSNVLCCILHKGSIRQLISNLNLGGEGKAEFQLKMNSAFYFALLFYIE